VAGACPFAPRADPAGLIPLTAGGITAPAITIGNLGISAAAPGLPASRLHPQTEGRTRASPGFTKRYSPASLRARHWPGALEHARHPRKVTLELARLAPDARLFEGWLRSLASPYRKQPSALVTQLHEQCKGQPALTLPVAPAL